MTNVIRNKRISILKYIIDNSKDDDFINALSSIKSNVSTFSGYYADLIRESYRVKLDTGDLVKVAKVKQLTINDVEYDFSTDGSIKGFNERLKTIDKVKDDILFTTYIITDIKHDIATCNAMNNKETIIKISVDSLLKSDIYEEALKPLNEDLSKLFNNLYNQ